MEWLLLGLVVGVVVYFNWPKKKEEKQEEIQNIPGVMNIVTTSDPNYQRNYYSGAFNDRKDSNGTSNFVEGALVGALAYNLLSSHSSNSSYDGTGSDNEPDSDDDGFVGGGGSSGGGGASVSWDDSSNSDSDSSCDDNGSSDCGSDD